MRTGTKILLFAIIIPSLAFFLIYFIAKKSNCMPNCKNKICGDSDGCSNKCKDCPNGGTCDGTKCQIDPKPGPGPGPGPDSKPGPGSGPSGICPGPG